MVYDEETDKIRRGIYDIGSPERAMQLFEWEKEEHPEKFEFLSLADHTSRERSKEPFAVSEDNPVRTVSIADSYAYLKSIRTKTGQPVRYERIGSVFGKKGNIIDAYRLHFDGKELRIYIDSYATENSTEAPEGLTLS